MITLPYCFCNTEVRAVVKLHWDRWKLVRWYFNICLVKIFDIFISVNLFPGGIEGNLCISGLWELSTSPLWPTPWLLPLDSQIRYSLQLNSFFYGASKQNYRADSNLLRVVLWGNDNAFLSYQQPTKVSFKNRRKITKFQQLWRISSKS